MWLAMATELRALPVECSCTAGSHRTNLGEVIGHATQATRC